MLIRISRFFLASFLIICHDVSAQFNDPELKPCIPCNALKSLKLPDVLVNGAVTEEEKSGSGKGVFCRISGTIGEEINFELLLPSSWNGRFVMGGGGGYVGSVANVANNTVKDGYATAGTDTGHKGNGIKADWALNNAERQVNFGHLAIHRTAVVSRALVSRYYCSEPQYSYFIGCSRGGGQAMMEAQRYPGDFNGIVAGAPAFHWPGQSAEFIQNMQYLYPDPDKIDEPLLTRQHLRLLQDMILDVCDLKDGVKDDILNDPRECDFDFSSLPLCGGRAQKEEICFTEAQVEAIRGIYEGVSNKDGEIYSGFPFGGENEGGGWYNWIVGPVENMLALGFPTLQYGFGTEFFKYFVFGDSLWDFRSYDFSTYFKDTRFVSSFMDASRIDYSGLKQQGGKMIIYHGWSDAALSALSTIDHYEQVLVKDTAAMDYLRLFLLPGVLHCGGGPGPDKADWLMLIRQWVELGQAPERVIVSKTKKGRTVITRPVFPYPKKAVYDGKGKSDDESSFQ